LPTTAADEWAQRTEIYLRDNLGERTVARFRKDADELYGDAAGVATPRMGYWRAVRNRRCRCRGSRYSMERFRAGHCWAKRGLLGEALACGRGESKKRPDGPDSSCTGNSVGFGSDVDGKPPRNVGFFV